MKRQILERFMVLLVLVEFGESQVEEELRARGETRMINPSDFARRIRVQESQGAMRGVTPNSRKEGYEVYKECGGVLTIGAFESTTIEYKNGQAIDPTEFCAWTLLVEDLVSAIHIAVSGGNTLGLTAYFWNDTGFIAHAILRNETWITFQKPPVLLTMSSSTVGAQIWIIADGRRGTIRDRAYHIGLDQGQFSFPNWNGLGEWNEGVERVTVVVHGQPKEEAYRKKLAVKNIVSEPGSNSVEIFTIWEYDVASKSVTPRGRLIGNETVEVSVENYFPTIILYKSMKSSPNNGFSLRLQDYPYFEVQ